MLHIVYKQDLCIQAPQNCNYKYVLRNPTYNLTTRNSAKLIDITWKLTSNNLCWSHYTFVHYKNYRKLICVDHLTRIFFHWKAFIKFPFEWCKMWMFSILFSICDVNGQASISCPYWLVFNLLTTGVGEQDG